MSGFSTRLEEVYIFQETRKSVPANQKVISIGYSLIRISLPWQFKVSFSWCIMIVVHQKSWCCRIFFFFFLVVQIWSLSVSCSAELKNLACGVRVQSGGNDLFWFFLNFFFNRQKPCWSHSSPSLPLLGRWRPLSLYLSVTQQDSVFSCFALHPPLLYIPHIFSHL